MYMSSNLFESHPEQIKERSNLGYRARRPYQIIVRCEHITVSFYTQFINCRFRRYQIRIPTG